MVVFIVGKDLVFTTGKCHMVISTDKLAYSYMYMYIHLV